jgi:hypothetical protein
LDLQARVLLRSLFEEINILIAISSREKMMKSYCKGVNESLANSMWSLYFRTTKHMKKLISEIEYELGFKKNSEIHQLIKENRNYTYQFLSSVTHGSLFSNLLGSYSFIKDEEDMPLALFGSYTDASSFSLEQLNWQIYYLVLC